MTARHLPLDVGVLAPATHIARVVRKKGRKVDFGKRSGSHG